MFQRPWLLRRLSTNHYALSRTACFEAAKLDFQLRRDFAQEVSDQKASYLGGQFKTFNTAMIAGISAIIDPRGPDGDHMRQILATFLEQNPWHEAVNKDATTQKEVQIVSAATRKGRVADRAKILTLSRRAAQTYESSFAPGDGGDHNDSATTLLALSQTSEDPKTRSGRGSDVPMATNPAPAVKQSSRSRGKQATTAIWAKPTIPLPVHAPGPIQFSPTTSSHPEDDHSQRL